VCGVNVSLILSYALFPYLLVVVDAWMYGLGMGIHGTFVVFVMFAWFSDSYVASHQQVSPISYHTLPCVLSILPPTTPSSLIHAVISFLFSIMRYYFIRYYVMRY